MFVNADIKKLQEEYQHLFFLQKWLFPKILQESLTCINATDFSFYNTYNKLNILQKFFLRCVRKFSNSEFVSACKLAQKSNLLTEDNFNLIASSKNPAKLTHVFRIPDRLFTDKDAQLNREVIAKANHPEPLSVALVLKKIQKKGLLFGPKAESHREAVRRMSFEHFQLLEKLIKHNLLDTHALIAIADLTGPRSFIRALQILADSNLFSEPSVSKDIIHTLIEHRSILFDTQAIELWNRIPPLTRPQWEAIAFLCNENKADSAAGVRAFTIYVNRTLNFSREKIELNGVQSTHTASVHKSVSDSVTRLKEKYGSLISDNKLHSIIDELCNKIQSIDTESLIRELIEQSTQGKENSEKEKITGSLLMQYDEAAREKLTFELNTAKRFLTQVMKSSNAYYLNFHDKLSNVSTREAMALIFIALQQEDARAPHVTFSHGLITMISGFYQIQRGYNISGKDVDDKDLNDGKICLSGAFNKCIESQQSILIDVEILMSNHGIADMRFPEVVKQCLFEYIKSAPKDDIDVYNQSITNLLIEGVGEEFWSKILEAVQEAMLEEFSDLYSNAEDSHLQGLLKNVGEYVPVTKQELGKAGIEIITPLTISSQRSSFFSEVPLVDEPLITEAKSLSLESSKIP